MSYDIWLEAELGGPPVQIGHLDWNYTSNVAAMWRAAGADLAVFDGRSAGNCAAQLEAAITTMELDPDRFRAMDPKNGWGSFDSLLPRLRELLAVFREAPDAIVRVNR